MADLCYTNSTFVVWPYIYTRTRTHGHINKAFLFLSLIFTRPARIFFLFPPLIIPIIIRTYNQDHLTQFPGPNKKTPNTKQRLLNNDYVHRFDILK